MIPTKTIPQGITAVINYSAGISADENEQTMMESISAVKTGEITYAVRDTQIDDKNISLTRTEFELLALLLSQKGHVFSRQQLIERVWPKNVVVTDRTVDVNITRLRKKIGRYAAYIATRQGYGYCFEM